MSDARLYAAVVERARTRWPDTTPESIAAVLQTRAPEAAALYEVAGPELNQLVAGQLPGDVSADRRLRLVRDRTVIGFDDEMIWRAAELEYRERFQD
ncbi:unnamed protein product [[Actinomadura] parvosata subsp. kistnae]|uniref:Uncharacterized protein n=1 Tax=[Actinomadura] parvosata subsp. kistnae TaxID=1909395 RepID=A0A1U9ZXU6_9ACTN|nr:hypothetical protein [Nonomuraea sp. ATCC 55076]AQZ62764.1 hypothetical protein BKM31_16010 [Nonomuraea sp. ATCC 55076]SPL98277.1 unnamed protein product [Actinomadura parvosata subsp. kistnae]